jgi:hypothetical protein
MSSYSELNDPGDLHDERGFVSAKMVAKFCSMGKVTSNKWFPCYITGNLPSTLPCPICIIVF